MPHTSLEDAMASVYELVEKVEVRMSDPDTAATLDTAVHAAGSPGAGGRQQVLLSSMPRVAGTA